MSHIIIVVAVLFDDTQIHLDCDMMLYILCCSSNVGVVLLVCVVAVDDDMRKSENFKTGTPIVFSVLEIETPDAIRCNRRPGKPLETLYFGGGTPSLLPIAEALSKHGRISGVNEELQVILQGFGDIDWICSRKTNEI